MIRWWWWVLMVFVIALFVLTQRQNDEIVVARFNEDISWIDRHRGDYDITVYNKGPNEIQGSIKLPNVGNESHTYLWHIVNRYDSLAPRTVFVMGSAISRDDRRPMLTTLFEKLKMHNTSEFGITCNTLDIDLKTHAYSFKLDEYEKTTPENKITNGIKLEPSPERPFGVWYEANFGNYQTNQICYVPNFAVTREEIRRKPKSYYKHLLEKYLSNYIHPEAGHYFERAWYAVFYS